MRIKLLKDYIVKKTTWTKGEIFEAEPSAKGYFVRCGSGIGVEIPFDSCRILTSHEEVLAGKKSFSELVAEELQNARFQHGPMRSPHEGLAVLREEYVEFEQEVFRKEFSKQRALEELASVAAMCHRLAEDVLIQGE
jgi:hypothetical protein